MGTTTYLRLSFAGRRRADETSATRFHRIVNDLWDRFTLKANQVELSQPKVKIESPAKHDEEEPSHSFVVRIAPLLAIGASTHAKLVRPRMTASTRAA